MNKEFTKEMVEQAIKANASVKGTARYGAYYVPLESKNKNGKWVFLTWTSNYREGIIKNIRGTSYVYYKDGYGNEFRFELTTALAEKLGLVVM